MSARDRLYDTRVEEVQDFVFDERVVRVFPDMINRSVPGYALIVPIVAMLARRYAQDNSKLYDLGCSLGASALAMSQAVEANNVRIVAIDNERHRATYVGPISSYYEFVVPPSERLDDEQWQSRLSRHQAPPRPAWTKSFQPPAVVRQP